MKMCLMDLSSFYLDFWLREATEDHMDDVWGYVICKQCLHSFQSKDLIAERLKLFSKLKMYGRMDECSPYWASFDIWNIIVLSKK